MPLALFLLPWCIALLMGFARAPESHLRQSGGPLSPGQVVPDLELRGMLNYKDSTARLSDFRGKLVLLDFWTTSCGACLSAMPKLEELQQQFRDSLQILAVTSQSIDAVARFRERNRTLGRVTLPLVTGAGHLEEYFPYRMVPHLVWISPEGRLISQTTQFEATPEAIRAMLRTGKAAFKTEKKDNMTFRPEDPLFLDGNGGSPFPLYRSLLTPYVAGLPAIGGTIRTDSTVRFFQTNASIMHLYKKALGLSSVFPDKQVLLESPRARAYQTGNWQEEKAAKAFCYELLLPQDKAGELQAFMQEDLRRHFGLVARVEERKLESWVLQRRKRAPAPRSQGGPALDNFFSPGEPDKFLQHKPLDVLIRYLDQHATPFPVVDQTGITHPVDLRLDTRSLELEALNAQLAAYGLELRLQQVPLRVLVIR